MAALPAPRLSHNRPVQEATISRVHAAYRDGSLDATALVRYYLDRIAAIDRQGPSLQSLLTLNPRALDEAQRLDAAWRSGPTGPLGQAASSRCASSSARGLSVSRDCSDGPCRSIATMRSR